MITPQEMDLYRAILLIVDYLTAKKNTQTNEFSEAWN